ncbi:target of Myb protein 1 isoform X2 [Protopterus annectens]|uniref:target of Myb protein 1 isoform X2 n=1 Tax=Protopterus annectens TaxID=7888 RepID=UPI001CFA1B36|nr:target of Myb protein 1 isoform X2 [Protopterus annectens]
MEFLMGNPFASPVGQRIEHATNGALQSEDWALNMDICDVINETEEGPKDAIRALKKRIVGNKNFHEVMLALTVLETCVKNCGHRFHVLVASHEFVEGVLVKAILPKNNPPNIVQDKVLNLIQAWADAFRSSPDLTGVVAVYEDLRRKGLEFPMTDLDSLSPIHTPQRSVPDLPSLSNHQPSVRQNSVPGPQSPQRGGSLMRSATCPTPVEVVPSEGPIIPTPEQVMKLRKEMEVVNGNGKVMSEMLTELVPGQASSSDVELLQELNRTCRTMQQRILELIPRLAHEQLTEELLLVNDNLNNVFLRYDRFERYRVGQSINNKVPPGIENTRSLVDLVPSPSQPVTQSDASNLSSQLAGMNVGTDSVSSALKTLDNSQQPKAGNDEFDMFAQSRSSSLAEQRKNVKYEEPQAIDGLAGALDTRQQNTGAMEPNTQSGLLLDNWLMRQGMIPVTHACLMDDIEQWLSADMKGDGTEDAEGVTSEEFDKFLEERAKAGERLPTLPSPPSEMPGVPSASKKKQEKADDTLFAL